MIALLVRSFRGPYWSTVLRCGARLPILTFIFKGAVLFYFKKRLLFFHSPSRPSLPISLQTQLRSISRPSLPISLQTQLFTPHHVLHCQYSVKPLSSLPITSSTANIPSNQFLSFTVFFPLSLSLSLGLAL